MNNENKQAYKDVLAVLEKHKEVLDLPIKSQLESFIKLSDLSDLFGINLINQRNIHYSTHIEVGTYAYISWFGDDTPNKRISWSDDNRQPSNEWLYVTNFPTGAYIFGDRYPEETFKQFFDELCSYEPKYKDTRNKGLYFCPDKAKHVHENFKSIYNKYAGMVSEELKQIRIKEIQEELNRLKETP